MRRLKFSRGVFKKEKRKKTQHFAGNHLTSVAVRTRSALVGSQCFFSNNFLCQAKEPVLMSQ